MTTTNPTNGAQPSHRLYVVTGTGKSSSWREIGAAWPNKDREGFSITCDAVPLTGRIVMRKVTERPARAADRH